MKKSLSTIIKEDARNRKERKGRRVLKAEMQTITPELLACEQELAQDWLSPEDDNAWAYLHTFLAGERKGARQLQNVPEEMATEAMCRAACAQDSSAEDFVPARFAECARPGM